MPDGLAGIGAEQGVFAVAGAICVVSAANAVLRRDPLTSALSLTLTLFSLAILYLGLDAPFLAAVQVAVYAGAVMVLLVFVIMLLGAERRYPLPVTRAPLGLAAILISGSLFAVLALAILRGQLPTRVGLAAPDPDHVGAVADLLFTRYLLPFEVASVLLLAALIAAVSLARRRSSEREWPGQP
ncbi:MAG TPA: NADH-quinone oxidoreductase subunit J [Candidatus Limnocylindria bacterium]